MPSYMALGERLKASF